MDKSFLVLFCKKERACLFVFGAFGFWGGAALPLSLSRKDGRGRGGGGHAGSCGKMPLVFLDFGVLAMRGVAGLEGRQGSVEDAADTGGFGEVDAGGAEAGSEASADATADADAAADCAADAATYATADAGC